MFKRKLVRKLLAWSDGWNHEIHQAVEARVIEEFTSQFPNGAQDHETMIANMRTFFYARMSTTATILIAVVAVLVSLVSLLVSALALLR